MAVSLEDRKQILRLSIEEMRRTYDWLDGAFVRMKTKTLTFIGGGLATLTFLYADGDVFIPNQVNGKIFYFAALGLLLAAIAILLTIALKPYHWEFSIENKDMESVRFPTTKDFLASEEDYLLYVKERYYEAYSMNMRAYEYSIKWLSRAFLPLLIGAIMLTVLKIFGT